MTTPSGTISLDDVNVELEKASGSTISMNDSLVRLLADKSSGAISMDDLRGKSYITPLYGPAAPQGWEETDFGVFGDAELYKIESSFSFQNQSLGSISSGSSRVELQEYIREFDSVTFWQTIHFTGSSPPSYGTIPIQNRSSYSAILIDADFIVSSGSGTPSTPHGFQVNVVSNPVNGSLSGATKFNVRSSPGTTARTIYEYTLPANTDDNLVIKPDRSSTGFFGQNVTLRIYNIYGRL